MNPIFKKLNFKEQKAAYIVQAPDTFRHAMDEMREQTQIRTTLTGSKEVMFFLVFVTKQEEVNDYAKKIDAVAGEDAVIWFAYPKGTSKKYKCEFNRDSGWKELGTLGFEGVRMVAIDDDWSALRFRKAENIKSMKRSFAMSDVGKKKVAAAKKRTSKK
ncbi:MAG TPA: hypothetical protein VD927_10020 [Chryseosolibacter sp.]|nr:hypothetical protein [Chryseosolibacter sp.]